MKITILALIISLALLFSGKPITKPIQVAQADPIKVEVKEVVPINIDYLFVNPHLYFSYKERIYMYRNPEFYIQTARLYRFPVLGRLLRTHITIHGPQGRGVSIGVGRHTHN